MRPQVRMRRASDAADLAPARHSPPVSARVSPDQIRSAL
jgi:hypothetical protein